MTTRHLAVGAIGLMVGALAVVTTVDATAPPSTGPGGSEPPASEPTATTTSLDDQTDAPEPSAALATPISLGELRFIGEVDIPNLTVVGGTLVGGLSGIDYDPLRDAWIIISDDRSDLNPARFYDSSLTYDGSEFSEGVLLAAHPLLQQTGASYPGQLQGGAIPDPESIRVDPHDGSLWWTSEGNQELGLDPLLTHANPRGLTLATYPLPDRFGANPDDAALGSRNNKALEGLTFAADGESLYAIMEGALYQDAELPTLDHGSVSRIVQFDLAGNVIAEYAYPLDPLPAPGEGDLADLADNGATEILAVSDTTLLVIERAGIPQPGPWDLYVRIYEIDLTGATDVSDLDALADVEYTAVSKALVLDLQQSGLEHVDNIEGITFGPDLDNGNRSLVLVSDNNFDPLSVTQLLAYEVEPTG